MVLWISFHCIHCPFAMSRVSVSKPVECKVCKDSGKSKSVYSSHKVKNSAGKVVCPTLLSQHCSRCYNVGHTIKFCIANIDRKISDPIHVHVQVKPTPKANTSMFEYLMDEDEDEDEDSVDTLSVVTTKPSISDTVAPEVQIMMPRTMSRIIDVPVVSGAPEGFFPRKTLIHSHWADEVSDSDED